VHSITHILAATLVGERRREARRRATRIVVVTGDSRVLAVDRTTSRRLLWVTIVIAVACTIVLAAGVRPARAAFPGANGKIAFSTLSAWEDFDISVMNADGSGLVPLTSYGADDAQPAFSPDGSRIAFTSNRTGDAEIFVMDADGTDVKQVTSNPVFQEFDPAFSADGSRIAFASDRDGNRELYVIRVDGSGQTRLTTTATNEEDPAFSADGSRLAFTSDRDGNREIYVAAADGANPVRLTVDPAAWVYGGLDAFGVHLAQESFHPSAAGHAELGRCVGEFLRTSGAAAACRAGADGHLHVAPSPPAKAAA